MREKPRIYFVNESFYPLVGGAETQTLAQCASLLEKGYEATVVTYCYDKRWLRRETINGLPVIRVAAALMGNRAATLLASREPSAITKKPRKLQKYLRKLASLLAMFVMAWTLWRHRHNYDILHVCEFSKLAFPTSLICRLTGKPMLIVVISAGSGNTGISGQETRLVAGPLDPEAPYLKVEARTLVGGDLEGLLRGGRILAKATKSLLERVDAVVVVLSTRMKKYIDEYNYRVDIALIPNGVDVARFHPSEESTNTSERAQVVVCVSQMRYEKGIDVLLQAWHIVHQEQPQARLILVGRGAIQRTLQEMAEALDIAGSVEFAGLQKDVPAQLHRGSIAVLPSRWEGLSNALLEEMSSGLACVATRVSGSEDVIQHGVNGLLVESEDYLAMAQALLMLIGDPELARRYGRAARATVEQHYSLERVSQMYADLYKSLMDRQPRLSREQETQQFAESMQ